MTPTNVSCKIYQSN